MSTIKQRLLHIYYKIKQTLGGVFFPSSIQIVSPHETLEIITSLVKTRSPGAYLRFGDGEINILDGRRAIEQGPDQNLAREMQDSLLLSHTSMLKSLMIHSNKFGCSNGMKPGVHLVSDDWAEMLLMRSFPYFIGSPIYSHAAFAYSAVYEKNLFIQTLKALRASPLVFVGNKNIPRDVVDKLFGKQTIHIQTEPSNTYAHVDAIEEQIFTALTKNSKKYTVVIFAAGPTSNVLQKRLAHKKANVFSIDIGSTIDAFVGSLSRTWIEEAPGGKVYWSQLLSECNTIS